jgi:hypothetical protein
MKGKRRFAAGAALSAILLLLAAMPALAALETVSAYAYGIQVRYQEGATDFNQGPTPVAGPIPATGGADQGHGFNEGYNQVGPAKLYALGLDVSVQGFTSAANNGGPGLVVAAANISSVIAGGQSAMPLNGTVTADRVLARCSIDEQNFPNGAIRGETYVWNVTIAGQSYADVWPSGPFCLVVGADGCGVPPPNTVIPVNTDLFVGTVTLNEQTYDATTNTLTVNGIHMRGAGGTAGTGDIIISHVECDGLPAGPAPVIPESPLAILIPLVGLAAIGGAWYLRRNPITRARH